MSLDSRVSFSIRCDGEETANGNRCYRVVGGSGDLSALLEQAVTGGWDMSLTKQLCPRHKPQPED